MTRALFASVFNITFVTADDFEVAIVKTMVYTVDAFPRAPTVTFPTTPGASTMTPEAATTSPT